MSLENTQLIERLHADATELEIILGRWRTFDPRAARMRDAAVLVARLHQGLVELIDQEDPHG